MRHSVSVCPSALCQLKTFSPKSLPRHVRCCIHFFTSNTQKCRNFFKNFSFIQYAAFILRQWFLPFFYVKSWSNLKPNGSFEICSSWGFRNTPYMLNLMKFWLRYLRLKTSDTTSKFNFDSTFIASLEIEPFLKPWISNEILHQIQRSWAVLMII